MSKISMEACQQMSYELVFQRYDGPIMSYCVPKIPTLLRRKITFDLQSKTTDLNQTKKHVSYRFFETNSYVAAKL